MISGSNVVCLRGNLTSDPELAGNSNNIAKFTIAVSYAGSNSADADDKTGFFDCVSFLNNSQSGDFLGRMIKEGKVKKGSSVEVVGALDHRRWRTENNEGRSKISIIVEHFGFASGGGRREDEGSSGGDRQVPAKQASAGEDNFLDF